MKSFSHTSAAILISFFLYSVPSHAILNGKNTPDETFYHSIAFIDTGLSHCSGLLVAPNVVLTAAHCIALADGSDGATNDVWFDSEQSENFHRTGRFFRDPSFIEDPASPQKQNDYAIGILDAPMSPADASPIAVSLEHLRAGETVSLAGYGTNNDASLKGLNYGNPSDRKLIDDYEKVHPGMLYSGESHVNLFQGSYVGISSANEAALAPGDSGSPLLTFSNGTWHTRGIATRAGDFKDKDGIQKNVSIYVPLSNARFLEFVSSVQKMHDLKICGMNLICE